MYSFFGHWALYKRVAYRHSELVAHIAVKLAIQPLVHTVNDRLAKSIFKQRSTILGILYSVYDKSFLPG